MTKKLPITGIGDPYILKYEETYYLYATSVEDGFYVWQSNDLENWSAPSYCYRNTGRSFGNRCFWAPEVYFFNGKFYMYYTAQWKLFEDENLRIGVAVSDSPAGPFLDVYDQQPMFDFGYGVLDAHVFTDDDGQRYFYYSRAGHNNFVNGVQEADIYVTKLCDDCITVHSDPILIIKTDQEWETRSTKAQFWNEGPFVLKKDGRYHLMYSANFFESIHYGIGGAVSDSPMGPFQKYPHNPIFSAFGEVSGPGHNSVTVAPDGETLICVYHAHTDPERPSGDRQACLTPMTFEDGYIKIQKSDPLA